MPRKKKEPLPVFAIVEMPKWKAKIVDIVTSILFPGERYFVLTVSETGFTSDGKGKYTDEKTGLTVDVPN
jgi:hypothetical protein